MLKKTLIVTALMATVSTTHAATKENLSDLFEWAQDVYPQFFPGDPSIQTFEEYEYVYYPETGNYIGYNTNDNAIYVLGPQWNNQITYVAPVSDLFQQAGIAEKFNIAMSNFPIVRSHLEGSWLLKGDADNSNFYVNFNNDGTFTWIDGMVAKGVYTIFGNQVVFAVTDSVYGENFLDGLTLNASISTQAGGIEFLSLEKDGYQYDAERLSPIDTASSTGIWSGEWLAEARDGYEGIKVVLTDDNKYVFLNENDDYGSSAQIEAGDYTVSGSALEFMPTFDHSPDYSTELRSAIKADDNTLIFELLDGTAITFNRI